MDYQAFTNDSLTMMYEAVRGALAADDASNRQGIATQFRVRETSEWKTHAANLEQEMLKRGMLFAVIDWSEVRQRCRSTNEGAGSGPRPDFVSDLIGHQQSSQSQRTPQHQRL